MHSSLQKRNAKTRHFMPELCQEITKNIKIFQIVRTLKQLHSYTFGHTILKIFKYKLKFTNLLVEMLKNAMLKIKKKRKQFFFCVIFKKV